MHGAGVRLSGEPTALYTQIESGLLLNRRIIQTAKYCYRWAFNTNTYA